MNIILWLLDTYPAPLWPASSLGWLGWFVMLGLLFWLVWTWRQLQLPWKGRTWGLFIGLVVFYIAALIFGLRLPAALPLPGALQK